MEDSIVSEDKRKVGDNDIACETMMLYELCWLSQLGSYMKEDFISGIRVEKEGGAQSIIINSSGLIIIYF